MDNIKNIIGGGIIMLVVGGGAYSISQEEVVNNFADDTNLTQKEALEYVKSITEDQLGSWTELGEDEISESKETLLLVADIDCVNYEYEWETPALSCTTAKTQLRQIAAAERALGEGFIELDSETANEVDMRNVIRLLDKENEAYDLPIAKALFDQEVMSELKMTNSYNKSLLVTALESE